MNRFPLSVLFLFVISAFVQAAGQPQNTIPQTPAFSDSPIDVASLSPELRHISSFLEKNPSPHDMVALRDSLPNQWTVTTTERTYSIPTDFLRGQLSAASSANAKAWVDHLAGKLDSYPTPPPSNTGESRAELDRILAGPEFASVHAPTAWDIFRQRLAAWLERIFIRLFGGLTRYPMGGQILFWLIVVVGVSFIALWVFRFMVSRDRMESLPPGEIVAASRTWQEWIRSAREAASRNDFREAVHSAYWAGIARLEDTGTVPKERTKTPREYLRLVSQPSPHELAPRLAYREPLTVLTTTLERVWYANRSSGPDDFRDSLRQLEALGCQLE